MVGVGVKDAFGGEWFDKYAEARKKTRLKKLDVSGDVKIDLIKYVKANLKPEKSQMNYYPPDSDRFYDIVLAETPDNIQVQMLKYGPKVNMQWNGKWLGVFVDEISLGKLQPNEAYILVGKIKTQEGQGKWEGRTFYNFTLHGLLTMQEIAEFDESKVRTEADEIKEKVEEHTGDS